MNKYCFQVFVCVFLMVPSQEMMAQYQWNVRDPLDLNVFDFGDNKLLLYNGIGVGLTTLLSKKQKAAVNYQKHSFGIHYFKEYRRSPLSEVMALDYRRRWSLSGFLFVGAEARVFHVSDVDVSTQGVGCSITFEWHIVRKPNFRLIFDNGVGPNLFFHPFPFGGTNFNFSTKYGLRFDQKISSRWWYLGLNNVHISNADIKGQDRNPALDALGVSIGLFLD